MWGYKTNQSGLVLNYTTKIETVRKKAVSNTFLKKKKEKKRTTYEHDHITRREKESEKHYNLHYKKLDAL